MHSQLSLQAISYLSIPEIAFLEAKLPLLLHGQEIKQIGPFEQFSKERSEIQHLLPEGYEWCSVNHDNYKGIGSTCAQFVTLEDHLKWIISHPQFQNQYLLGIRKSSSKKIVTVTYGVPISVSIGGKLLSSLRVVMAFNHSEYSNDVDVRIKLWIASCKKIMNNCKPFGISQAVIRTGQYEMLKPLSRFAFHMCPLPHPLPYNSPEQLV